MNSHVALCLAGAARLQIAFDAAILPDAKQTLLQLAADVMDKTTPNPKSAPELAVRRRQAESQDQVEFLIQCAVLLLPIRQYGWPARRVRPNQWPAEHAPAMRTLEQLLMQSSPPAFACENLAAWLTPAWERYPQLRAPCESLLSKPD